MAGTQRTTTPTAYLDGITARVRAARVRSKLSPKEMAAELSRRTGYELKLYTYRKWETRTPIGQEYIIPFCRITGVDVYALLTGAGPFEAEVPQRERDATPQLREKNVA